MAYRNWLYNIRNITGYTGDLNDRPTVYFQLGHAHGHITQSHKHPINIGREQYAIHAQYRLVNQRLADGRAHLVEHEGRQDIHTSRNAFIPRAAFNRGDLLTLSLHRFPDIKRMYTVSQRQMRRKAAVQAELLNQFDQVRNNRLQLFYRGVDRNPAATKVIDRVVRAAA